MLVEVLQTVKICPKPKEVEALVYRQRLHNIQNSLMNWTMSNITVKIDKNDNISLNKSMPEAKIDGSGALFTAMH